MLGRDAVTINSGGEKIFAEEVEAAVRHHPGVRDVIVVGRPSERWGSEVVAIVEPEPGAGLDDEELLATCAREIARYKLPKAVITVDRVKRNPAGKADYAWAKSVAAAAAGRLSLSAGDATLVTGQRSSSVCRIMCSAAGDAHGLLGSDVAPVAHGAAHRRRPPLGERLGLASVSPIPTKASPRDPVSRTG